MKRPAVIAAIVLALIAIVAWWGVASRDGDGDPKAATAPARTVTQEFRDTIVKAHGARSAKISIDPA